MNHHTWAVLIACCLVWAFNPVVSAGEPTIPTFYVDYAVVQHSLKGDQGLLDELMEIATYNDVLANFWWEQVMRHCEARMKEVFKREFQRIPQPTKEDIITEVQNKSAPCRHNFYVDHWAEINGMIRTQYQALKKDGSR